MSPTQRSDEISQGHVLAGKYRLDRPIARGGMGTVWRAMHLQLNTPVAVKILAKNRLENASIRARFEGEARAAALLKSKHVVAVHDYGIEGEVPFIVMELLDGEDLDQRLRRLGGIPLHEGVRIIAEVGKALHKAHSAGLVHRDLKPSNIFLTRTDEGEIVKVVDFGVAKLPSVIAGDNTPTEVDEFLGSPVYMSPEQVRSARDVDARADLWSIGVIIYRVLTGKVPFEGKTPGDLLVKVCTDPHLPPSRHHPGLPPKLDSFIDRALAKDPEDRFQSASELVAAFAEAAGIARASLPSLTHATTDAGALIAPIVGDIAEDPFPSDALTHKLVTQEKTQTSSAVPMRRTSPMRAGAIMLAIGGALAITLLIASSMQRDPGTNTNSAPPTLSTDARPPIAIQPPTEAPAATSLATPPERTPVPSASLPPPEPAPSASASAAKSAVPWGPMPKPTGTQKRIDLGL